MPSPPPPAGRIAGVDFGTRRIGIAVTDPDRTLASPLENYTRRTTEMDAQKFRRIAEQYDVRLFVVGLPVHLDGRESRKSEEARAFGRWLGEQTGVAVEFFDERFTSVEAEQFLLGAELTRKRRKARLDMVAAQIMLATYLESTRRSGRPPEGLED